MWSVIKLSRPYLNIPWIKDSCEHKGVVQSACATERVQLVPKFPYTVSSDTFILCQENELRPQLHIWNMRHSVCCWVYSKVREMELFVDLCNHAVSTICVMKRWMKLSGHVWMAVYKWCGWKPDMICFEVLPTGPEETAISFSHRFELVISRTRYISDYTMTWYGLCHRIRIPDQFLRISSG
jgi:hypothetical protein